MSDDKEPIKTFDATYTYTHIGLLMKGIDEQWKLPCGHSMWELGDIPCPCGNPNHWLVKREEKVEVET